MDEPVIWKSTIVILTEYDPYGVSIEDLGYEAERGDAYCLGKTSQPATPEEIALAGDFFFPTAHSGNDYGEDDEPDWTDRHSVNCIICDDLFDEREAIGHGPEFVGDICPKHKADLTVPPNAL